MRISLLPQCNPHTFRELKKILRKYDSRFTIFENKGKGSERMIYHPDILGKPASFPIKCHGEGTEIGKHYINDIIRRFNLPNGLL